jgi:hypothetical protein
VCRCLTVPSQVANEHHTGGADAEAMTTETAAAPAHRTRKLALAGALALLALPVAATVAGAQTPAPTRPGAAATTDPARLDQVRTRCLAEIDRRLATLDTIDAGVGRAEALTDDHAAAITAMTAEERSGLTELRPQVEAATDRQALEPLCRSIATDYRIYRLRVPQAHLTVAFDRSTAAATRLSEAADRLQAKIDETSAAGTDVSAAQVALDTMRSKLAEATGGIDGRAVALLALTPADYAANTAVVAPYREALTSVHTDLREAAAAGREAARALRG